MLTSSVLSALDISEQRALLQKLNDPSTTETELLEIKALLDQIETSSKTNTIKDDLIAFCQYMMPDYKVGKHHRMLADLLMAIAKREKDRINVNVAPRHGKSQIVSIFFAAWYMGHNPDHKVMMVSHTTDLAVDFGRKVRNLIATPQYQAIFPGTKLSSDSKSAGRWNTTAGGEYFACGVGSALAGRGAHLLLVDDPHSEQDVLAGNFAVFEKAYQWFTYGARTRLMPGGVVAIVQTRWHESDLTGRLQQDMMQNEGSDQYELFQFPAILEVEKKVRQRNRATGETRVVTKKIEKPLWPEFFDLAALHRTKASMPLFQWNSQYQQNPTSEEAAIIKREWWMEWHREKPPKCEYLIMTLDPAAEKHNRADFSAMQVWGVFFNEDHLPQSMSEENGTLRVDPRQCYNIILLNAIKDRMDFPELKQKCLDEYKYWEPDSFIVEKKNSGTAIYQELRRMGIAVSEYTPHRGSGDKVARLNSVADIVSSGRVWVPQTRWAENVVEEFAAFPFGAHDDQVDAGVMAFMRFRQGGFVSLPTDEPEEVQYFRGRSSRGNSRYY
jgi:predicted phage terminase large subunit-like protein